MLANRSIFIQSELITYYRYAKSTEPIPIFGQNQRIWFSNVKLDQIHIENVWIHINNSNMFNTKYCRLVNDICTYVWICTFQYIVCARVRYKYTVHIVRMSSKQLRTVYIFLYFKYIFCDKKCNTLRLSILESIDLKQ